MKVIWSTTHAKQRGDTDIHVTMCIIDEVDSVLLWGSWLLQVHKNESTSFYRSPPCGCESAARIPSRKTGTIFTVTWGHNFLNLQVHILKNILDMCTGYSGLIFLGSYYMIHLDWKNVDFYAGEFAVLFWQSRKD